MESVEVDRALKRLMFWRDQDVCLPVTKLVAHYSCPLVTVEPPSEKGLKCCWIRGWMAWKHLRGLQGSEGYLIGPTGKPVPWLAVKNFSKYKVYESMEGI